MELIHDVIDVLKGLSIIIASIVAIIGINSWSRETRWKKKHEISHNSVLVFYKLREAIRRIRNPFISAGELNSVKKKYNLDQGQYDDKNRLVYYHRIECEEAIINEFRSQKHAFMAVFGKEKEKYFEGMLRIISRVGNAAHAYDMYKQSIRSGSDQTDISQRQKELSKQEKILWENYIEEDPILQEIDAIIDQVEKDCIRYIR